MKKRIQVDSIRGLLPTIHKGETCPKEGGKSLIFPMIFKDSLTCVCLVGDVSRSLRDSSAFFTTIWGRCFDFLQAPKKSHHAHFPEQIDSIFQENLTEKINPSGESPGSASP